MANILFFGYNDGVMRRFFTLIITAIILLNASYAAAVTTHSAPMPSLINDFDDDKADILAANVPMPQSDDDTPNPTSFQHRDCTASRSPIALPCSLSHLSITCVHCSGTGALWA